MGHTRLINQFKKNSFWLSILLHLLVLLSLFHPWGGSKEPEKPSLFLPAYLYHDTKAPLPTPKAIQEVVQKDTVPTSVNGIQKPAPLTAPRPVPSASSTIKPLLVKKPAKDVDAIHLVGNKKTVPQPLIKLLAKALTASLIYPKSAVDFGLHGTAYVRFLVHPDGQITEVSLIKSSSAAVLDQAAVAAVTAISPLTQVGNYLSEPQYIVFGFIFG